MLGNRRVYTVRAIQEPVFSVAHTDFEGGGSDHGYRRTAIIFLDNLCATQPKSQIPKVRCAPTAPRTAVLVRGAHNIPYLYRRYST